VYHGCTELSNSGTNYPNNKRQKGVLTLALAEVCGTVAAYKTCHRGKGQDSSSQFGRRDLTGFQFYLNLAPALRQKPVRPGHIQNCWGQEWEFDFLQSLEYTEFVQAF
jgi:hypothetical protein